MYDSVNFWIDRAMVDNKQFTIARFLTNQSEHKSKRGYSVSGMVGNYYANIYETGVRLSGSLPKYLLSDNIQTLNRSGVKSAIEKLSDELHLPVNLAKVTRIDAAAVFLTSQPPANYFPYLGEKLRFKRIQATKDTLYYTTNKRQFVFYDKNKEAKAKGGIIPVDFSETNLMRVEARFTKRLCKQFNIEEITGKTLFNEDFYTKIIKTWANEYFSINKLKSFLKMDTSSIKNASDGVNMAFAMLLQKEGQAFIDNYIADLKAKHTYSDPKSYTRVKNKLKSLINTKRASCHNELIKELDKAVSEIVLNCR
jgi:hypothetical protein